MEFIKKDSPASARRFLQRVFEATRGLEQFPGIGHAVSDLDDPSIRQILVGRYRVLYEAQGDAVWIIRIVHGSGDLLLALGRRTREEAEGSGE